MNRSESSLDFIQNNLGKYLQNGIDSLHGMLHTECCIPKLAALNIAIIIDECLNGIASFHLSPPFIPPGLPRQQQQQQMFVA